MFKAVKILDTVYKILDPGKVADVHTQLSEEHRTVLYNVLKSKHELFKAKPGHWNAPPQLALN